jgi:hypothetical protein
MCISSNGVVRSLRCESAANCGWQNEVAIDPKVHVF